LAERTRADVRQHAEMETYGFTSGRIEYRDMNRLARQKQAEQYKIRTPASTLFEHGTHTTTLIEIVVVVVIIVVVVVVIIVIIILIIVAYILNEF
jgi:cell division protein FtsL